jgi:Cu+-exporting ATPase
MDKIDTLEKEQAGIVKIKIKGMSCVNCSNSIETYLKSSKGVKIVEINFSGGTADVKIDKNLITDAKIIELIKSLGFGAELAGAAGGAAGAVCEQLPVSGETFDKARLITAAAFALPVFILNMFFCHLKYSPAVMSVLTLPVLFYSGFPFHKKTFITIIKRLPLTMDSLISASSFSSYFLSVFLYYFKDSHQVYFDSAASIIAIILAGKAVEEKMRGRSRQSLGGIIEGMPSECVIEKDGRQLEISAADIAAGDTLVIKPNQRAAVDCVILSGEGFVEKSAITGESAPVFCSAGDLIWAASRNFDAIFRARALVNGRASYINQIENMLNQALVKKAEIQKTADYIASYFVPAVFGLALLTLAAQYLWLAKSFEVSIMAAISVIAIACPCAVGLALPTAFYFGANTAALNGIIFTDPDSLHAINKINAIVFDKTGTLTQNKLRVKKIHFYNQSLLSELESLNLIASLEKYSDHPIARAVVEYAKGLSIGADCEVAGYATHGGRGISAVCGGKKVAAGNPALVKFPPAELPGADKASGVVFYASIDDKPAAVFELEEMLTDGAPELIEQLKRSGIEVYLLTGDGEKNALLAGAACGIDASRIRHAMKPDEKAAFIQLLKEKNPRMNIAMAGDGINDALAMASADIAIAMADATNIARSAANIILSGGGLKNTVKAIEIGKKMRRIIMQNFFWAFFYNVILIPSAMAGSLNPMQAALAMAASSIFVVLNSARLKKI